MNTVTNNQPASIKSIFLYYGFPLGLFFIAITVISYLLNIDTQKWLGYINWGIMLATVIYCIYDVRNKQDGIILFGTAFKVAFLTLLIATTISSIYFFIHIEWVNPGYMEQVTEVQRTIMLERGLSESDINRALDASSTFNKPIIFIPLGIISNAIIAAILSVAAAMVMKKEA